MNPLIYHFKISNDPFKAGGHSLQPDLLELFEKVYNPCGLDFRAYKEAFTNKAYGACNFLLDKQSIEFRVRKVSSVKIDKLQDDQDRFYSTCKVNVLDFADFEKTIGVEKIEYVDK